MRKILDKMFENKKLAFWIPIAFATLVYILFLLFGTAEDKNELLISTPIVTLLWLFGVFFIVFVQVKNPRCPEWFLNFGELMCVVVFAVVFGFIEAISFISSAFQNFNPLICPGIITYSAISWAHNKRTKKED